MNLFAPNPVPVDPTEYRRYRDEIRPEAERFGVVLPEDPVEDDDHWGDKVDVLLDRPVPVVTFTFGLPDAGVVTALHRVGSILGRPSRPPSKPCARPMPASTPSSCRVRRPGVTRAHSPPTGRCPTSSPRSTMRSDFPSLPRAASSTLRTSQPSSRTAPERSRSARRCCSPRRPARPPHTARAYWTTPRRHHRHPRVHRTTGASDPERVHRRPPRPGSGRLPRPAPPDPPLAPGRRRRRRLGLRQSLAGTGFRAVRAQPIGTTITGLAVGL